jgi:hypothetical protein
MGTEEVERKLVKFHVETRKEFPDYTIVLKTNSWFMRFLGKLMYAMTFGHSNSFMEMVTTIGTTVYVPKDWDRREPEARLVTLRHERVHMRQSRTWGPLFSVAYLLLPLPILFAWCRTIWEREAYEESMRTRVELRGIKSIDNSVYRAHILGHFSGPSYFWAWVLKSSNEKWYDSVVARLRARETIRVVDQPGSEV